MYVMYQFQLENTYLQKTGLFVRSYLLPPHTVASSKMGPKINSRNPNFEIVNDVNKIGEPSKYWQNTYDFQRSRQRQTKPSMVYFYIQY